MRKCRRPRLPKRRLGRDGGASATPASRHVLPFPAPGPARVAAPAAGGGDGKTPVATPASAAGPRAHMPPMLARGPREGYEKAAPFCSAAGSRNAARRGSDGGDDRARASSSTRPPEDGLAKRALRLSMEARARQREIRGATRERCERHEIGGG